MKRVIALILAIAVALTLCSCNNQEKPEEKKKKKIVYIQRDPVTSEDDSSNENLDDTILKTETIEKNVISTTTSVTSKITSTEIGKNYYVFKPKVEHPGVAELDADYEMIALDKRNRTLAVEDMVIKCSEPNVELNGNILTIPYSIRSSGKKVTVSMYNKKFPNRTGSFTFNFAVQYTVAPTFLDEFNTLDTTIWKDDWYENRMPIEELYCEDGELVMYANENSKSIELSTTGTFNQAYGSFSARIKMPTSGLSCIAFWLCTESGVRYIKNIQRPSQSGGEIDIVEYFPTWGDNRTSCTLHYNGWSDYHTSEGAEPNVKQTLRGEYHIYSCVWTSSAIYFYLDKELIWTYKGDGVAPNSGPMQILLQHTNEKKDSSWGGKYDPAEFPNESRWDYVKVYGLKSE